jgi:polysaccharide biosynthesis protein PslH
VDGGTLAMGAMLDDIVAGGARATCLLMDTPKHPFRPEAVPAHLRGAVDFIPVRVDNHPRPLPALLYLLTGRSYLLGRFRTRAFADRLEDLLEDGTYSLVHLEGLYLLPYVPAIRAVTNVPVLYRAHNIEHEIWQRMAEGEAGALRRWYLKLEMRKLRRHEKRLTARVDGIMPIAATDEALLGTWHPGLPIATVPFGINVPAETPPLPCAQGALPKVFHLGAMDWLPNVEAVRWLLSDIWPLVHQARPGATLHLAGKAMPEEMLAWQSPGVSVQGQVPDAQAFVAEHDILAVPLRSGSGLRIKILESMALGRAVVTTSQGLQGIEAVNGEQVLVADTAEGFAAALLQLLDDPGLVQKLGRNARDFVAQHHNKETSRAALWAFYRKFVAE